MLRRALALVALFCTSVHAAAKPNLVLLLLDDIGWADVGFHGSDFPTPHMDAAAAGGVELERMYVMPQCSPTRAAIMTGRYSFTTGMQHYTTVTPGSAAALPTDVPTLAETLKDAGYSTHAIGKWHLGNAKAGVTPTGRGFDSYLGYLQGQTDYYNRTLASCGTQGPCIYTANCKVKIAQGQSCPEGQVVESPYGMQAEGLDWWHNGTVTDDHYGKYTVDDYMAEFARIVRGRAVMQKPFFVYFAQQLLHVPIEVPPEGRYEEACRGVTGGYPTTNRTQLCAMAARLDDTFAEIETTLRAAGEWGNTLVWVVSDNGGMTSWGPGFPASASSNWPLRGGKTTVFEGGVRAVSFVYGGWEGLPATVRGAKRTALTHAVDVLPTLVHVAGGEAPAGLNGENVWGTVIGTAPTARTELPLNIAVNRDLTPTAIPNPFARAARAANYTALIQWPWKVVAGVAYMPLPLPGAEVQPRGGWWTVDGYEYQPEPPAEAGADVRLFNIEMDPHEREDIAAAHPDVVARLMDRVAYWLSRDAGYRMPLLNIPQPKGNPANLEWTWGTFP